MPAKIIIQRKKEMLNKLRPVKVFIDGVEVGNITKADAGDYTVEPGTHTVQCNIIRYKSFEKEVVLKEGETKFLKVKMGMKYFAVIYFLLVLTLLSDLLLNQLMEKPRPDWFDSLRWAKVIAVSLVALYFIYYMTLGRKKYIIVEDDKDNIFSE